MIYRLQRLYSKKNGGNAGNSGNKEVPQVEQKAPIQEPHKTYTPLENERQLLRDYEDIGGNTAVKKEDGTRKTAQQAEHEYATRKENIEKLEKQRKRVERLEKREARKEARKLKFKKAEDWAKKNKDQAMKWAKKNKKGLIIGGSIAAGTGVATVVGSKVYKNRQKNKIKEDVRGYSDVED